jgi:hypothetical protein
MRQEEQLHAAYPSPSIDSSILEPHGELSSDPHRLRSKYMFPGIVHVVDFLEHAFLKHILLLYSVKGIFSP